MDFKNTPHANRVVRRAGHDPRVLFTQITAPVHELRAQHSVFVSGQRADNLTVRDSPNNNHAVRAARREKRRFGFVCYCIFCTGKMNQGGVSSLYSSLIPSTRLPSR